MEQLPTWLFLMGISFCLVSVFLSVWLLVYFLNKKSVKSIAVFANILAILAALVGLFIINSIYRIDFLDLTLDVGLRVAVAHFSFILCIWTFILSLITLFCLGGFDYKLIKQFIVISIVSPALTFLALILITLV
jgi:hypothetical protein